MQPWQLSLIVLASLVVGAGLPLAVLLALTLHRLGRSLAEAGAGVTRTLVHVEAVASRVEQMSRGLEGGDEQVAEVLTSVGHLARAIDKNLRAMNMLSTVLTSLGTVAASVIQAKFAGRAPPPSAPGAGDEATRCAPAPQPAGAPPHEPN